MVIRVVMLWIRNGLGGQSDLKHKMYCQSCSYMCVNKLHPNGILEVLEALHKTCKAFRLNMNELDVRPVGFARGKISGSTLHGIMEAQHFL